MKNILLPTDFSASSKNAIEYAIQLFKNEPCTFYVLHVQKMSSYISDDLMSAQTGQTVYESVLANPKKKLKAYVNKLKTKRVNEAHLYKTIVDYDSFLHAIKDVVFKEKIDLIVMGSNGASNLEEKVFGSNTLKVLREGFCPTLIIPKNVSFSIPNNILLPLVGDKISKIPNLESVRDLSNRFNSTLNIIEIERKDAKINTNKASLNKLKMEFEKLYLNVDQILDVSIPEAINSSVQLLNINLVVLLFKKENFLERLFKGSILDDINYSTKVPLFFFSA